MTIKKNAFIQKACAVLVVLSMLLSNLGPLTIQVVQAKGPTTKVDSVQTDYVTALPLAPVSWTLFYSSPVYEFHKLVVYNGNLYAASASDGRLFRFDGLSWEDLNISSETGDSIEEVRSLQVFENKLFIGTRVGLNGDEFIRIYQYDGSHFSLEFSDQGQANISGIEAFAVHNNQLYAANAADSPGKVYQRDSNGQWITLEYIESGMVRALGSYNGYLYAAIDRGENTARIWRWHGSSWEFVIDLASQFAGHFDGICGLRSAYGKLYAGSCSGDSPTEIFAFDGTNWTPSLSVPDSNWVSFSEVGDSIWATSRSHIYGLNTDSSWKDLGQVGAEVSSVARYGAYVYAGTGLYAGRGGRIYRAAISSISGRVLDGDLNGMAGVLVTDGQGQEATTDSNGNYALNETSAGTYTLTASKSGYAFSPASRTVTVPSDASNQDFTLPFLDLPFTYTPFTFSNVLKGSNSGGFVNSWFDHTNPGFGKADGNLTTWIGPYQGYDDVSRANCTTLGVSCYDSHDGIDFKHYSDDVLAAASGKVFGVGYEENGFGNHLFIDHQNCYATLMDI